MGPCSILGYFSSWGPLLVRGPGQVAPPAPPPLGGPGWSTKLRGILIVKRQIRNLIAMEIIETETQKIKRIYLSVHSGEHILSTDEISLETDNKDQINTQN